MRTFCLFLILSWASADLLLGQEPLFLHVYDPNPGNAFEADKGTNIILQDSSFYLGGGFINVFGGRSIQLLKLDPNGGVQKQAVLESATNDLILSEGGGWAFTTDGNILIAGESLDNTGNYMRSTMAKITPDLDTIWIRYFGNTGHKNFGFSVWETPDQHYMLFSTRQSAPGEQSTRLILTDTAGQLIWDKILPDSFDQTWNGNLRPTPDGNAVFCAHTETLPAPNGEADNVTIAKINAGGDVLWRTTLHNFTSPYLQHAIITALKNGGSAVTWAKDTAVWGPGIGLAEFRTLSGLDASGQKIWETSWSDLSVRYINSLKTAANGDIIGCGAFGYGWQGEQAKGWIFRLNPSGEKLWERFYTDSLQRPWSPLYLYDITEMPDGRLAAAGTVLDTISGGQPVNFNLALLVVDSAGCLQPGCGGSLQLVTAVNTPSTPFSVRAARLQVYPNPATESLTLQLSENQEDRVGWFSVYDMLGRLILRQPATSGKIRLDIHTWPGGFYRADANARDGQLLSTCKLMVRH